MLNRQNPLSVDLINEFRSVALSRQRRTLPTLPTLPTQESSASSAPRLVPVGRVQNSDSEPSELQCHSANSVLSSTRSGRSFVLSGTVVTSASHRASETFSRSIKHGEQVSH